MHYRMQVIFGATNCTWCTGQELYGRLQEDIAVLESLMPAPDLRRIQVRTVIYKCAIIEYTVDARTAGLSGVGRLHSLQTALCVR
jgi:hypothetical protein